MSKKLSKFVEPFIVGIGFILLLGYVTPIFVTLPGKAVYGGATSYIKAMNETQKKAYENTGKFLTNLRFIDLDLGYAKEGGKPDGKPIPIDPNDAIKSGYIQEIKSGFANKHHDFLSYINNNTVWNLAIPKMTYNFGNTNYFFWRKNIPRLDSYIGVIHKIDQKLRTSEQFRCTIDAPAKIPQSFIDGKVIDLHQMENKNIVASSICKALNLQNSSLCSCWNVEDIN